MSSRGAGRGRGADGGRGRGQGRGRRRGRGTTIWHYETYKPEPDAYDNALWRLRRAPPAISHTLPDDCPIPNAQSRILHRRQTEDEYRTNYYTVRITTHDGIEKTAPVPLGRILQFVSRRELSRFENAESRAEAEAVAAAARAEAEELARRNIAANERAAARGRGSRMLRGLGSAPLGRGRGHPKGRGRGRGRGRRLAPGGENLAQDHPLEETVAETNEDDMVDGSTLASLSPKLARSSYVANSALSDSPIAAHSSLTRPSLFAQEVLDIEESETDDDVSVMSGGAAHVEPEVDVRGQPSFLSDESDADRHRAKRRRTESSSVPRPLSLPTSKPFSDSRGGSVTGDESVTSLDKASLAEYDTTIVQHPRAAPSTNEQSHRLQSAYANEVVDDSEQEAKKGATEKYVVEGILDHSYEDGKKYYLVKWEGYEDSSDWVSAEDLVGAVEMVAEYEQAVQRRKGKGKLAMR